MKIEKINENQIKCTLNKNDLASRQIKVSELAYGTEKAKLLFQDMMQQAASEFGFHAEDLPLMIEAIPIPGGSIVLIITKVEDPEELDTRFSNFCPDESDDYQDNYDEFFDDMDDISDDTLMEDDSALTDLFQQIRDRIRQSVSQTEGDFVPLKDILEKYDRNGMTAAPPANSITQIFSFDSLNTLIYLTGFQNDFKMNSSLYKSPQDNRYYLIMDKSSRKIEDTYEFAEFCTLLAEYGQVEDGSPLREAYYKEHFDRLIARKALQKLQQINHTGGLR